MSVTMVLPNIQLKTQLNMVSYYLNTYGLGFGGLFIAPTTLSDTLDYAQFTPASFAGYAGASPVPNSVVGGTTETIATLTSSTITFSCTGGTPQTVSGVYWAVYDPNITPAALHLLAANLLPNGPQVVSQPGDKILAQLTLTAQRAPGQS